jgi:hypothetical protein
VATRDGSAARAFGHSHATGRVTHDSAGRLGPYHVPRGAAGVGCPGSGAFRRRSSRTDRGFVTPLLDTGLPHPPQIHISLTGDPTTLAVDFVAPSGGQFVNVSETGQSAPAACQQLTLNTYSAFFCTGLLTGLQANTAYTYAVGSPSSGWSSPFSITNQPADRSPVFAVYADFGFGNDESLAALIKDSDAGGFDYVIHAGDHAYDLDSSNSVVGNDFMNSIQPYAARRPYMAVPGNHEAYGTQGGGNFTQFAARYAATAKYAGAASGSNTNLWYSFETPLIHWIGFTGETWTMNASQLAEQVRRARRGRRSGRDWGVCRGAQRGERGGRTLIPHHRVPIPPTAPPSLPPSGCVDLR